MRQARDVWENPNGIHTIGCPVCGYGVDRTWEPWLTFKSGTVLLYFEVGWMRWEYLCDRCWSWADAVGALWDGKLNVRFEGFKMQ